MTAEILYRATAHLNRAISFASTHQVPPELDYLEFNLAAMCSTPAVFEAKRLILKANVEYLLLFH